MPGVAHGFTLRPGGAGPDGELHLAQRPAPVGPFADDVLTANWSRAIAPHDPASLVLASQVHGRDVLVEPEPRGPLRTVGAADGLVSTRPGVVVAVRTADCVPVLLVARGSDGRAAGVAAVHAGWRGAAVGIVGEAVVRLCEAADVEPDRLLAAVGPSICGAHYEVGQEVVEALLTSTANDAGFVVGRSPRGRPLVDVARAVASQLTDAGVGEVERLLDCTFEQGTLWSHRRDGAAGGRQAAWITRTA